MAAEDVAQCELKKHFDTIASEVQSLQKFVSDSTLFLTAYDIRNSQQVWLLTHFYLPCMFPIFLPCVCFLLVSMTFTKCLPCLGDFVHQARTRMFVSNMVLVPRWMGPACLLVGFYYYCTLDAKIWSSNTLLIRNKLLKF